MFWNKVKKYIWGEGGLVPIDTTKEIERLKERLRMLECNHNPANMKIEYVVFAMSPYVGRKVCGDCGKTIEHYTSKQDMLKAKKDILWEKIKEVEEEMKGVEKNG